MAPAASLDGATVANAARVGRRTTGSASRAVRRVERMEGAIRSATCADASRRSSGLTSPLLRGDRAREAGTDAVQGGQTGCRLLAIG